MRVAGVVRVPVPIFLCAALVTALSLVAREDGVTPGSDELRTGTAAPSAPGGPAAVPADLVVLPPRPVALSIAAGKPEATRPIRVRVRNADLAGTPSRTLQLMAADGTCPAGTVVGLPDFDRRAPGAQDQVVVGAGKLRTALVTVRATQGTVASLGRKVPYRCRITATVVPVPGVSDLSPANDVVGVELDLVDRNDPESPTLHEALVRSARPAVVTVARGKSAATSTIRVVVANADVDGLDAITLAASDGDCPPGTVGAPDFDAKMPGAQGDALVAGGRTAVARIALAIDADRFLTFRAGSPARCTAILTAAGPAAPTDPESTNDVTRLSIDVVDSNDVGRATPTPTPSGLATPTATPSSTTTPTLSPSATPSATPTATPTTTPTGGLPPEPETVAPPLDGTVATNLFAASAFLHEGANPIQTGVSPGTIDPARAAVVRGRVVGRDGSAIAGATVAILAHAELGQTTSRASGGFDLVVNGGGPLTVTIESAGFLPAQRTLDVPWQSYALVPEVVLVVADALATTVDLGSPAPFQVVRGSPQTDSRGTRQATLLLARGTQGELVLPGGASQPVTELHVRLTEYTVGEAGPAAMPAGLPPTSGYTCAVELGADEVQATGATTVRFSRPALFYLENFVGMPAGIQVPAAFHDRTRGAWVPTPDGRVVRVLAILPGGIAELDTDGDGSADEGSDLSPPVTADERAQLGALYGAGQSLWRTPVSHFTAYDLNYGVVPGAGASRPTLSPPQKAAYPQLTRPTDQGGWGQIQLQNQVFREKIPLAGTSMYLAYASDRAPGYLAARSARIRVSGPTLPPGLKRIGLEIEIAGRREVQSFAPASDLTYDFQWDGRDVYGRPVRGDQTATARVDYFYDGFYALPFSISESFGFPSGVRVPGDVPARVDAAYSQSFRLTLGHGPDGDVGGWTVDAHHVYDPVGGILHLGDGSRRSARDVNATVLTLVAGTGYEGDTGDGGPAASAQLNAPQDVAVAPDGSVYVADTNNHRIRRVSRDGSITTVAGTGQPGSAGEGVPATSAELSWPCSVAVGPDGSLFVSSSSGAARIRRISPEGILTTFAGNGTAGFSGDGGPALQAEIGDTVLGLAVAPDGTLYFTDAHRIRTVAPNGRIATLAGTGVAGFSGDDGPATAARFSSPSDVARGPDGSLHVVDAGNSLVRRIGPEGTVTTIAGVVPLGTTSSEPSGPTAGGAAASRLWRRVASTARELLATTSAIASGVVGGDGGPALGTTLGSPRGIAVSRDGTIYLSEADRVRLVDTRGIIRTFAGGGQALTPGMPAAQAYLDHVAGLDVGPDGSLYLADPERDHYVAPPIAAHLVARVGSVLPGFDAGQIAITGESGRTLHQFDASGRHLSTRHALTGATLLQFDYDAAGRLIRIEDASGNVTALERAPDGGATGILAPFGQRTVVGLDPRGTLASVTTPGGRTVQLEHDALGLLTRITGPRGHAYTVAYDPEGRVLQALDPAGGSSTVSSLATAAGRDVSQSSALGRQTAFSVEDRLTGALGRSRTARDGTTSEAELLPSGRTTNTAADGAVGELLTGPDPVHGMQAPLAVETRLRTPAGLERSTTLSRTAVLSIPGDPLSLASRSEAWTVNGRTWTRSYDATTRTFTTTSPLGRQRTRTIDAQGRTTDLAIAGLAPVHLSYDAHGRPASVAAGAGPGARVRTFTYDAAGFLASVQDPAGRIYAFGHDPDGRLVSQVQPDGATVAYGLDDEGNRVSVTAPSGAVHTLAYDPVNLPTSYTPPPVGGPTGVVERRYDLDHQLTRILRADGTAVDYVHDPVKGRPSRLIAPERTVDLDYDPSTGRLARVSTSEGVAIEYSMDAFLRTAESTSGPVPGLVERTYDDDLRLTTLRVNGGAAIDQVHDDDGLVVQAGALSIERSPLHGAIAGTTVGRIATTRTYDGFGALASEVALDAAAPLFSQSFTRDALDRVVERTETIEGSSHTFHHEYDPAGRLARVDRDGLTIANYTYDANGNRLTAGGPATVANYDAQDRLLVQGGATYTYTAAGDLATRTVGSETTTFVHDARGNLIRVELPGGPVVEYLVDGRNRRIGRKLDGVLVRGWLYRDDLRPIAELDGSGNVVALFVYVGVSTTPALVLRDGAIHRVLEDGNGSPRLVVDTATGLVVQRMDYDAFGRVTLDTAPGSQPFGFAGGLYDPATDLVRLGRRDYDAEAGRWIAKDPIGLGGGDLNLYAYAGNDPVNGADPLGTGPALTTLGGAAGSMIIGGGGGNSFNPNSGGGGGFSFNRGLLQQSLLQQQAESLPPQPPANPNLKSYQGDTLTDMAILGPDAATNGRGSTTKGSAFEVDSLGFKPGNAPEKLSEVLSSRSRVEEDDLSGGPDGDDIMGELYQTFAPGYPSAGGSGGDINTEEPDDEIPN